MILLFMGEHVIVQEAITCIKDAGGGKTNVWTVGQSAEDGFLVDMPYDDVMSLITDEEDSDGAEESKEEVDSGDHDQYEG